MKKLTVAGVEKQLRKILVSRKCVVKLRQMRESYGELSRKGRPATIYIDPHRAPVSTLLHELVHYAYDSKLEGWGQFEEPIIENGIELVLLKYIERDPDLFEWWRQWVNG